MTKRALIVANSHFDDPGLSVLHGAVADATRLASVLEDPTIGAFEVTVLRDGSSVDMKIQLQRFFEAAQRDDMLLLHISTHGDRDESGSLHFIARDTDTEYLAATGVAAAWVNDRMQTSPATRVLLLLDCCYSGAFADGLNSRSRGAGAVAAELAELAGHGRVVITASSKIQLAHDSHPQRQGRDPDEPSLFTGHVIAGLETGYADIDGDGYIDTDDLYRYVEQHVRRDAPNQTPTMSASNRLGGPLVIAKNRGSTRHPDAVFTVGTGVVAAPGDAAPDGIGRPRRKPRHAWRKHVRGALVGAAATAIVAAVIIAALLRSWPAGNEGTRGTSGSNPPNPWNFMTFGPLREEPSAQPCLGLFGMCIDQSIDAAVQAFGHNEALGIPPDHPEQTCHSWDIPQLRGVSICAKDGKIVEFALFIASGTEASIALPDGIVARFPLKLGPAVKRFSERLGSHPYALQNLDGEGYWSDSAAWRFTGAEGITLAQMRIGGNGDKAFLVDHHCDYGYYVDQTADVDVGFIFIHATNDDPEDKDCPPA
ncbi:caspase family protein [Dactylosporangium sp. AC04546]|uniref:caspase family protein n=1 Tax=Dactylosporangium sp. AC04546 TaxID=2862460 RepID=UPI001EE0A99F|nr:caspase family protein [Dactylosporangium sp. AC04546]WVK78804.1 caspase family protein [Dactylosporangium sp. AC04546]